MATAHAPTPHAGPWLHGPVSDLLLGYGLGYVVAIPVLFALAQGTGAARWPTLAAVCFGLFASGPHYGATLLRVYEHAGDRQRYAFFAVWVTLALFALFVAGLHSVGLGSVLVTLYATWSPWHFAGQNYGLALMSLRRRGIAIAPGFKRWLYASFVLSFALAFLELHARDSRVAVGVAKIPGYTTYHLIRFGVPDAWVPALASLLGGAYVVSLVCAARAVWPAARPRDLVPAACLVLTQSLWFTLPALVTETTPYWLRSLPFSMIWISTAHAIQYLWVTSYYAKRQDPRTRTLPYLGKALVAGSLLLVLPGLVFAPSLLGTVAWDAGLGALVFSVVNLHHFILDGAIWKLRDNRVARLLLRDETPQDPSLPIGPAQPAWRWRALVAAGALLTLVPLYHYWELEVRFSGAGGDTARARSALERLRFIGRDSPRARDAAARTLASSGELDSAVTEYERSLSLFDSADTWIALGRLLERRGDWDAALAAHEAALALEPEHPEALFRSALAALRGRDPAAADPTARRLSIERLERLRQLDPGRAAAARTLSRLRAAEGS